MHIIFTTVDIGTVIVPILQMRKLRHKEIYLRSQSWIVEEPGFELRQVHSLCS